VFAVTATTVALLSYARLHARGLARHPEDLKVFQLARHHGAYDRLILADSVTENATAGIAFDSRDMPLLTHGWMRLAGQYFLLRRALENNSFAEVDLFAVPDLFLAKVDNEAEGRIRHTYTDTIFTRSEEIRDLRLSGDAEAGTRFVLPELLYKSWQPGSRRAPERTNIHEAAPTPGHAGVVTEESRARIDGRSTAFAHFAVTKQNQFFMRKIEDTCVQYKLKCRLFIEPLPQSLPRVDLSFIRELAPSVTLIDLNEIETFPDRAFRDGLHLSAPWAQHYRTVLVEQHFMRFREPLKWRGEMISFAQDATNSGLVVMSGFHAPEKWGRWTNGANASLSFDLSEERPSKLVLSITGLIKHGPQRLVVAVNGADLCSRVLTASGDYDLACVLPESIRGKTTVSITTSYATSPHDWGEADNRSLGVGLRRMTLD